jgi:hypothetical protein
MQQAAPSFNESPSVGRRSDCFSAACSCACMVIFIVLGILITAALVAPWPRPVPACAFRDMADCSHACGCAWCASPLDRSTACYKATSENHDLCRWENGQWDVSKCEKEPSSVRYGRVLIACIIAGVPIALYICIITVCFGVFFCRARARARWSRALIAAQEVVAAQDAEGANVSATVP